MKHIGLDQKPHCMKEKMMKRIALSLSLVAILVTAPITACNPGMKLSKDEVKRILEEHFKYPIGYGVIINFSKNRSEEPQETIDYLIKNRFIDAAPVIGKPTEQGKNYLYDSVRIWEGGAWIQLPIVYAKRVMKSVGELLVDTKNGTAMVEYTEILEPNEPIYTAVYLKSYEGKIGYGGKIGETTTKKARLKHYDKGWRVDE